MFYAIDKTNTRYHIDETITGEKYFCPLCKEQLVLKKGNIISHHFSHKSKSHCDPWFTNRMSPWHRQMQEIFPVDTREVIIRDEGSGEYHIADASLVVNNKHYIFEFQHSPIAVKEFIQRSQFYLHLGYSLIWIFDFRDDSNPKQPPKQLFYEEKYAKALYRHVFWPGKDRIRLFDSYLVRELWFDCRRHGLDFYIFFHVCTGCAECFELSYINNFISTTQIKWQYINKALNQEYFIRPDFTSSEKLSEFDAAFYTKNEFIKYITQLIE